MNVTVKGKQIDVGDALRGHVGTTLTPVIEKYFARAIETNVVFSREGPLIRVDIAAHAGRGIILRGHASAEDPYAAFDTATEHVAKRLRRYKRRLTDHHKARAPSPGDEVAGLPAQQYVLADDADTEEVPTEEDVPVIIAESATEILALTVSEAVMRMNFADVPAMVFRNKAHGRLNAIYRRPDGNIGWVDPENPTAAAAKAGPG